MCSFIFIFFMGALYEGIKWFRVYFQLWVSTFSCNLIFNNYQFNSLKTSDATKSNSGCLSMNVVSKGKHRQGIEDALIEKTAISTASSCPSGCGENTAAGNANTLVSQEVYAPTVVVSTPAGVGMQINRWT